MHKKPGKIRKYIIGTGISLSILLGAEFILPNSYQSNAYARKKKSQWQEFLKRANEGLKDFSEKTSKKAKEVAEEYDLERRAKDFSERASERIEDFSERASKKTKEVVEDYDLERKTEEWSHKAREAAEKGNRIFDNLIYEAAERAVDETAKLLDEDLDEKERESLINFTQEILDPRPGQKHFDRAIDPYLNNLPEWKKNYIKNGLKSSSSPSAAMRFLQQNLDIADGLIDNLLEEVEKQPGFNDLIEELNETNDESYTPSRRTPDRTSNSQTTSYASTYRLPNREKPKSKQDIYKEMYEKARKEKEQRTVKTYLDGRLSVISRPIQNPLKKIGNFFNDLSDNVNFFSNEEIGILKTGDTAREIVGENYASPNITYKFPETSILYDEYGENLTGDEVEEEKLWTRLPVGTEIYNKQGIFHNNTTWYFGGAAIGTFIGALALFGIGYKERGKFKKKIQERKQKRFELKREEFRRKFSMD